MQQMNDLEIPMSEKHVCGTCGTHNCQAVRHIEDVAADLDELRREVRACERHQAEDCRKLWYKLGAVIVALAAVLPTGWATFLGLI